MEFKMLKECLDHYVKDYNVPGVDCIVYKDHKEIFRYFSGVSDIESGKKVDGSELYYIFSMTKILTCAAALQLFEKGAYKMDDPISKYMPEYEHVQIKQKRLDPECAARIASGEIIEEPTYEKVLVDAKNPITVHHLFTMQGGLNYALKAPYILNTIEAGKTSTRELAGAMAKTQLGFEPGTRYCYSLCHDVLGALIEIWSGMSFGEYMRKNVFEPLGMKDTHFGYPRSEAEAARMATLYRYDANRIPEKIDQQCPYTLTPEYESGGAGLISSPSDYILFLDALSCGGVGQSGYRILKEETVKMMATNQLKDKSFEDYLTTMKQKEGYGYGYGVRVHMNPELSGAKSPIGELGWDGAAGAYALSDAENGVSIVYFQHVMNWGGVIHSELRDAFYSEFNK